MIVWSSLAPPEELRALIRDLARRTRASSAQLLVTYVLIWLNDTKFS
jgi:hypothetical protein